MRTRHVMTTVGLLASALIGVGVVSHSDGTGEAAPSVVELDVRAADGVPGDATAAVVNIGAARASSIGYVAAWPCDEPEPETSILNFQPGAAASNSTIIALSDEGTVCVSRSTDVDLIVDVNSVFGSRGAFVGQNPERLLDSRESRPVGAGDRITLDVAGKGSVPSDASAAVVNITAARATDAGFVVAWPCGGAKPPTSALNFRPGPAVASSTSVALAADGRLCLETSATTDLIVDVNGAIGDQHAAPFVPQRLVDTRSTSRPSAGSVTEVDVRSRGGLTNDVTSAILNITAARPSAPGFVKAWPCGEEQPETATLNYIDQPVSNTTIIGLGTSGRVCMSTSTSVDLIVDVNGALPKSAGVVDIEPARIIDTRTSNPPPPTPDRPSTPSNPSSPPTPGTRPPSGASFAETFDGNSGLDSFDAGVYHRDSTIISRTQWSGDHDLSCGAPTTQRTIRRDTDQWRYTCKDHMMTSIGDTSGYSTGWFAPKQTFAGQNKVSWDVNVTDLGGRQWWEVMIVPADFRSGVPQCPQCAVTSWLSPSPSGLPAYPNGSVVVGNGPFGRNIRVHTDGADREVQPHTSVCDLDPEGCASKPIRRTFSITDNDNGTVTIDYGGFAKYTVAGSFPDRFSVVLKDHNYTPEKDNDPVGFTWHWDNIFVSG